MKTSRIWKIVYLVSLAVLLVLLYMVGRPANVVVQSGGEARRDPGGLLAQYRTKEELTEAQLGEIDPAGSAVKLATFGMRGVAVALLWHETQEYQKRKDWNNVIATSNQLVFLEPHFRTIWEYLGWNLAYNASAEFDDYRERYRWVIRGIDFLATGVEANRKLPKLYKATGWTISQKVGGDGSDEKEQYRRLLREDEDFGLRHDCPLPSDRDNFMLGRRWYQQGEDLVMRGASLMNESDFIFFANSRLNLFHYAVWKRKDGIFGEEAIRAWENAGEEWREFGRMDLATAIPDDGTLRMTRTNRAKRTKLEVADVIKQEKEALLAELNGLVPDLREKLALDRWKELAESPGQQGTLVYHLVQALEPQQFEDYYPDEDFRIVREWLDKNEPDWQERLNADLNTLYTPEQLELRKIPSLFRETEANSIINKAEESVAQIKGRALEILRVTPKLLAEEIQEQEVSREVKSRARAIVEELDGQKARNQLSKLFRDILNYEYRFREVAVERSSQADEAHRLRYEARKAYYAGEVEQSITGWLNAMKKWDELLALPDFKHLVSDGDFIRDKIDVVEKFVIILDNSNKIFSDVVADPVPLRGLMKSKLERDSQGAEAYYSALDYAIKEYQQGEAETNKTARQEIFEKTEEHFAKVAVQFEIVNGSAEFMKVAPFYDVRDRMLEANAYYVRTLAHLGKPIPERVPLRGYVELMLKHDPVLDQASEGFHAATPLLLDKKYADAQTELDKSVAAWKNLLEKYPIIQYDPTNTSYSDAVQLARRYAEVLKAQDKPVPDDFPLKVFLQ